MDTAWTLQLIQGILARMDQIQAQIQSVRDNHDQFNAALPQQQAPAGSRESRDPGIELKFRSRDF